MLALGGYAGAVHKFSVFAAGLITSGAALLVGGFLGFLFAIPRRIGDGDHQPGTGWFRSSGSLEEIADWLTKILVGLGLVELGKLVRSIRQLVDFIGPSLGPHATSRPVALGLLTLFSFSGFLFFYLATRIHLAPAFAHAEEQLSLASREAHEDVAASVLKAFAPDDPGHAGRRA